MFSNLVESGSHASEFKRRGRFFVGTLAFYGLLLAAAGVGSVYAFNAHLDEQSDYEVYAMLRFRPDEPVAEPARPEEPRAAASASRPSPPATRIEISVQTPYKGERIASESTREVNPRARVIEAPFDSDPEPGGLASSSASRITGGLGIPGVPGEGPPRIEAAPPPPPPARTNPKPAPTPRQERTINVSTAVLVGKAVHKPVPPYPTIARQIKLQGAVPVQVLVDEQGRVVSARATSGHPFLQPAAVQAARQARFAPTILNGQPVKVSGVITYNFTLQ